MLDIKKHDQILKNILRDLYTNTNLEASLGFKGGTCLYLFYDLDRFSVDLDFNLLADTIDDDLISTIVSKYLTLIDHADKQFTHFWLGSYKKDYKR